MSLEMAFLGHLSTVGFIHVIQRSDHMMTNIFWPQFAAQLWHISQDY